MMKIVKWAAALVLGVGLSTQALAQGYPNGIVKLVVPYPPGGVVDITGRLLAVELEKVLGATVIVENKAGAGGTVGTAHVAKAKPDGYTILFSGAATHAFAPALYKQLRYDPVKDFETVTQLTQGPLALVVNANSGIKDLAGFLAATKGKGGDLSYASNGNGTYPHLSVELMKQVLDSKPVHVAYKGGGQAVTALLGEQVQFSQNHIPIILPHVKSGRLRVLATTGDTRSVTYPDAPTLKESGIDVVASAWFGLFVPAGTPAAIVDQLYKATEKAVASSDLKEKLAAQGDEVLVQGPAQFRKFQLDELSKWAKVIADAGLEAK